MAERDWEVVHGNKWTPIIGDCIQGYYVKTVPAVKQDESNQYILEVDGKEMTVFGTTDLDSKFKEVPLGWEVRITFMEEKKMKPPKHPFKVFEVKKRPPLKDEVSGIAGEDEPTTSSLNEYDSTEVCVFVDGVEEELHGKGVDVSELNMFKEAQNQIGDEPSFWKMVKEEIRKRNYTG